MIDCLSAIRAAKGALPNWQYKRRAASGAHEQQWQRQLCGLDGGPKIGI
jgi:hypothetical protein